VKKIKEKISYLGPEGTFSWLAAKKIFSGLNFIPAPTIGEVFGNVENRKSEYGIIPIQNSIGGMVLDSVYAFLDFPSVISLGSFQIPIKYCLIGTAKNFKEIKIIKSHPQALSQCSRWIGKHLPRTEKEPVSSTIVSLEGNMGKEIAILLPKETAQKLKLKILAENIENSGQNFTRFCVISRNKKSKIPEKLSEKETFFLLSVRDRVGVLRDILGIFSEKKINLSALHSIPLYSKPWDYMFFLQVAIDSDSAETKNIIKSLKKYCPHFRILGKA
jgi:chorismate mutase/prephenate dehydratase